MLQAHVNGKNPSPSQSCDAFFPLDSSQLQGSHEEERISKTFITEVMKIDNEVKPSIQLTLNNPRINLH